MSRLFRFGRRQNAAARQAQDVYEPGSALMGWAEVAFGVRATSTSWRDWRPTEPAPSPPRSARASQQASDTRSMRHKEHAAQRAWGTKSVRHSERAAQRGNPGTYLLGLERRYRTFSRQNLVQCGTEVVGELLTAFVRSPDSGKTCHLRRRQLRCLSNHACQNRARVAAQP